MQPSTERLIRADIVLRRAPFLVALLVFFGTVVGLALIGALGFLARFLHSGLH